MTAIKKNNNMPNLQQQQDASTNVQPDDGTNNTGFIPHSLNANPNNKREENAPQRQSINPEEIQLLIQRGMEQVKFELKKEIVQSINAKAQQLSDVDPVTATSMQAIAGAINEAVSEVTPFGGNDEFNQQMGPQQQVKQSSDELAEFIWDTMVGSLEEKGYFEKNASFEKEQINDDLMSTFVKIGRGMEKFAEDNDVDFLDPNYQDLLKELILDGTLYNIADE